MIVPLSLVARARARSQESFKGVSPFSAAFAVSYWGLLNLVRVSLLTLDAAPKEEFCKL